MRGLALLFPVMLVAACGGGGADYSSLSGDVKQDAELFAQQAILQQFPSYPASGPVAGCVAANATDGELRLLAGQNTTSSDRSRRNLAVAIASRPDTQACMRKANVPPLR